MREPEVNDVVQITDQEHYWFGCPALVDKIRGELTVRLLIAIPYGESVTIIYINIEKTGFKYIGKAQVGREVLDGSKALWEQIQANVDDNEEGP